jgi:hypothetical protein
MKKVGFLKESGTQVFILLAAAEQQQSLRRAAIFAARCGVRDIAQAGAGHRRSRA